MRPSPLLHPCELQEIEDSCGLREVLNAALTDAHLRDRLHDLRVHIRQDIAEANDRLLEDLRGARFRAGGSQSEAASESWTGGVGVSKFALPVAEPSSTSGGARKSRARPEGGTLKVSAFVTPTNSFGESSSQGVRAIRNGTTVSDFLRASRGSMSSALSAGQEPRLSGAILPQPYNRVTRLVEPKGTGHSFSAYAALAGRTLTVLGAQAGVPGFARGSGEEEGLAGRRSEQSIRRTTQARRSTAVPSLVTRATAPPVKEVWRTSHVVMPVTRISTSSSEDEQEVPPSGLPPTMRPHTASIVSMTSGIQVGGASTGEKTPQAWLTSAPGQEHKMKAEDSRLSTVRGSPGITDLCMSRGGRAATIGGVPWADYSDKRPSDTPQPWMQRVVGSTAFDAFFVLLIIINSVTIGLQTDVNARELKEETEVEYMVLDKLFCATFTVELLLRIVAFGPIGFVRALGIVWATFDVTAVVLQLVEEVMMLAADAKNYGGSSRAKNNVNFVRALRILRLVRVLRIIRIIRFMDELRTLVVSIVGSMRSLFWTLALLVLGIYVVAIYFTQLVLDYRIAVDDESSNDQAVLAMYYGSLSSSMLTLYGAMSGGLNWNDVCMPLINGIGPVQGVIFAFYIAFTVLALTNVVTGVFVEGALKSAKQEEENVMLETLRLMFWQADTDGTGCLTTEQFKAKLDSPEMSAYLQSIDVDPGEANMLFRLIDRDDSGFVDYEEFVGGCMRIRGNAKAIDTILLLHEVTEMRRQLNQQSSILEERLEGSGPSLPRISGVLPMGGDDGRPPSE